MSRVFIEHDGYFDLIESPNASFNVSRTRIIVTGNAMGPCKGMQIVRWHGYKSEELPDIPWSLAENPYAGIYLLPEEWEKVFASIKKAKATEFKDHSS